MKQLILLKADDLKFDKANIVSDHWRTFIDFLKLKKNSKTVDLKFDKVNIVSVHWRTFIDFIKLKKIKASLGLVGNSLEIGNARYISYLKDIAASGYFELWNHGYSHLLNGINADGKIYHEFWNTSYEYQMEALLKTQALAKEKLDVTLHCFGAPGNNVDRNTLKVLEDNADIKVWYFGLEDYSKLNLKRLADIEIPLFSPNFQQFKKIYDAQKPYLVLQVHPNGWNKRRFSEFKKIIDFLIQEDVTFINPTEYYGLIHNN